MSPLDSLRAIHDELWDASRGMDRYAPGVVPGVDISGLGLHSVRETALGAFLDLEDGNVGRALVAIDNVLALQYPDADRPWSGTFPVTAEQPEPPGAEAVEWVHYDPNWRQFLGCILAMCVIHHGGSLPAETRDAIDVALRRCVDGEPETRIEPWYTNPNLMHAWLLGHVGVQQADDGLVAAAERRRAAIAERFARHGDIDEYNSPTYDGIDLWALGLWATHPPTGGFAATGAAILERMTERISTLFHPRFGTTAGPYIRAYGLQPRRYVSLAGLCTYLAGQPAESVLPPTIGAATVHVHDLYFLPVLHLVASAFVDRLDLRPVTDERHHAQPFTGSVAESLLRPGLAVGWERGRRHEASLDQYVPFSAHVLDGGEATGFGVMVPPETAWIDVEHVDDLTFSVQAGGRDGAVGVRFVTGGDVVVTDDGLAAGPIRVRFEEPPARLAESTTPVGRSVGVTWASAAATVELLVTS